jgi:histidinol-phosphatase (PHP family)
MTHLTANYHTHTYRCGHAVGKDREYVENAIRAGLKVLGFSDHSPMIFRSGYYSGFRMPLDTVAGYFESLSALREEYKNDIEIHIGVEVEYYPTCFPDYLDYMAAFPLEYKILGQHFVWDEEKDFGSFKKTDDPMRLASYYENLLAAVKTGEFLYVAHPDVLNYTGPEDAYVSLTEAFLQKIGEYGAVLELNRLGFADGRHYPNRTFWTLCGKMDIPAVIGVDAHNPPALEDADTVNRLWEFAQSCGVRVLPQLPVTQRGSRQA